MTNNQEKKEIRLIDVREPEERARRIRRFLTSVTSLQLNDKVDQNEFVKFSD